MTRFFVILIAGVILTIPAIYVILGLAAKIVFRMIYSKGESYFKKVDYMIRSIEELTSEEREYLLSYTGNIVVDSVKDILLDKKNQIELLYRIAYELTPLEVISEAGKDPAKFVDLVNVFDEICDKTLLNRLVEAIHKKWDLTGESQRIVQKIYLRREELMEG